jgi:hypothetical protein
MCMHTYTALSLVKNGLAETLFQTAMVSLTSVQLLWLLDSSTSPGRAFPPILRLCLILRAGTLTEAVDSTQNGDAGHKRLPSFQYSALLPLGSEGKFQSTDFKAEYERSPRSGSLSTNVSSGASWSPSSLTLTFLKDESLSYSSPPSVFSDRWVSCSQMTLLQQYQKGRRRIKKKKG